GCLARRRAAMLEAGAVDGRVARLGPSPGIENLRWLRPTREGDTIRYYSQVMDKRESASRPGWGIVTSQGSGYLASGERVFELTAAIFWERRPP
ncbi:MAG TPA: dehydratase, partial [Beijerinckiaceae bacterium]|nr:dehydratase [Beijerinckiaceae bacterium]